MKKISYFFLLLFLISCKSKITYIITSECFNDFSEHELAKAVEKENINEIKKICGEHPEIVDKTYNVHGYTVLHWAVETGKYKSVKALLEAGMNPNADRGNGETPLDSTFISGAVFPPLILTDMIPLLIKYGADCNLKKQKYFDKTGITPFMNAIILDRLDIAKTMIQYSKIDVDLKTDSPHFITATDYALFRNNIDCAHFLICECKANIEEPFYISEFSLEKPIYPVSLLRRMVYPLNSEQYKLKLEIIEEFKKHGIDYYAEEIPNDIFEIIKIYYPDTWEEYVKVY